MSMSRLWLPLASFYGLTGVILGAFGAHALRSHLSPEMLAVWHTAVDYQFWHALALGLVGVRARRAVTGARALRVAGWAFALGVPLFSGSLYLLAVVDAGLLGIVTPFGGLFFMVGWVALGIAGLARPKE